MYPFTSFSGIVSFVSWSPGNQFEICAMAKSSVSEMEYVDRDSEMPVSSFTHPSGASSRSHILVWSSDESGLFERRIVVCLPADAEIVR